MLFDYYSEKEHQHPHSSCFIPHDVNEYFKHMKEEHENHVNEEHERRVKRDHKKRVNRERKPAPVGTYLP